MEGGIIIIEAMKYKNSLISTSLEDEVEIKDGKEVYARDCHNLPICASYGNQFYDCLAGADVDTRCTHGEKMQIRILNDMNPNAIHKPDKPSQKNLDDYMMG